MSKAVLKKQKHNPKLNRGINAAKAMPYLENNILDHKKQLLSTQIIIIPIKGPFGTTSSSKAY